MPPLIAEFRHLLSAWHRRRRSAGFGIHSPFAYNFVRNVLRERLPYYCYESIDRVCSPWGGNKQTARLLFRVANHMGANRFLLPGDDKALAYALLQVSSDSRVYSTGSLDLGDTIPASRIACYATIDETVAAYKNDGSDRPFVVVTPSAGTISAGSAFDELLQSIVAHVGVVVFTGLHRDASRRTLWARLCAAASHGQSYTNDRIGIFVATPKLQREHFRLWM